MNTTPSSSPLRLCLRNRAPSIGIHRCDHACEHPSVAATSPQHPLPPRKHNRGWPGVLWFSQVHSSSVQFAICLVIFNFVQIHDRVVSCRVNSQARFSLLFVLSFSISFRFTTG
ncbi:hypothetical protein D1007_20790 [Hordeum vulgare]|nr:hypothetical protein D1007_20790 [Hordeum vulgare]